MCIAFGIGFTIPVMLVFLELLGVLTPQALLGAWRYAVVGTFVVAAAITPSGDPISLLALSGPMIVLYFLAILIGWLVQRHRRRRAAARD
jgi:sec-independent protein translocase protein TatC